MRKKAILAMFTIFGLNAYANATPGATFGAVVFGTGAAITCDEWVRSKMLITPPSNEPWYFVWHHVGSDDVAGFAAGTACAIPASFAGAALGVALETAIVGTSVTAVGAGAGVAAGKGLHAAWRLSAGPAKFAAGRLTAQLQPAKQWLGQIKFGSVAPSTALRTKHMENLYAKQNGMDAICNVPLPPLYVGPPWNRRLNRAIEVDHRIPKAKGGSDDASNLQLTHLSFNRQKQDLIGKDLQRAKRRFCPA